MSTVTETRRGTLPSTLRMGAARGVVELKQFFRDKQAVVMVFSFPALILFLLGSIFADGFALLGVNEAQVFAAGMIAFGVVSTAFITMGVGICIDREDGTLKRLRGTPITATAYFIGKLVLVAVATLAEVALLLVVGVLAFDMPLPTEPGRWLTFAWVSVLSIVACTLLGIAASAVVKSARSAPAVLYSPVIALQFVSGIFVVPITTLPSWMIGMGSMFPVKWMDRVSDRYSCPTVWQYRRQQDHGSTRAWRWCWVPGA